MQDKLTNILGTLLAVILLLMLYLYIFEWGNLPNLGRMFG